VDGASSWQEFWHIVLPSIRFVVEIATILLFVWNFNWFDMMWLLTQGGPGDATMVVPIDIYRQAFTALNFGQASAVAVLALSVPVVFALFVFRVQRQRQGAL
jgi:ABC-type sugar transport system permease subunit